LDQEDAKKNIILWFICGYSDPSQKQKIPKTQNQKMQRYKKQLMEIMRRIKLFSVLSAKVFSLAYKSSTPKQNWEPKPCLWTSQFKFRLGLDFCVRAWGTDREIQLVGT